MKRRAPGEERNEGRTQREDGPGARLVRGLTAMEYEGGKQDWIDAGYPTESGG